MLTAFRAIEVHGAVLKIFLQSIPKFYLTFDTKVVYNAAFQMFSPLLIGKEIDVTFFAIVVTGVALHMQQSFFVRSEPSATFAAEVV
jgi:hypothetical protein